MTKDEITVLPYEEALDRAGRCGEILHRDDIYGSGPASPIVSEEILRFVLSHAGKSVLDIGCGLGPYVDRLTETGRDCVGIETDTDLVEAARSIGRDVRPMSALALSFPDGSFDTVMMIEVLEHLPDPEAALAEAARVTRSNFVMTVPDISPLPVMSKRNIVPWHLLEATHVNFFTPASLRRVILRHFASCEVTQLAPFLEVEGTQVFTHIGAVARI